MPDGVEGRTRRAVSPQDTRISDQSVTFGVLTLL